MKSTMHAFKQHFQRIAIQLRNTLLFYTIYQSDIKRTPTYDIYKDIPYTIDITYQTEMKGFTNLYWEFFYLVCANYNPKYNYNRIHSLDKLFMLTMLMSHHFPRSSEHKSFPPSQYLHIFLGMKAKPTNSTGPNFHVLQTNRTLLYPIVFKHSTTTIYQNDSQ